MEFEKEKYKLNTIQFFSQIFGEEFKNYANSIQNQIEHFIKNRKINKEEIINSLLAVLNYIISQKIENSLNLKPVEFSFFERIVLDFLWLDSRIFKAGIKIYNDICNFIENNKKIKNFYFISDIIKERIEVETGLKEYFHKKSEKKQYEDMLFKLEDEKNKFVKLRNDLLNSLSPSDKVLINKYNTQSMKLEQEIPHIAEYNFKRKLGITISPKERDNLIRLEKEVEEDDKWRDTILSNFLKTNASTVYEIRKINKAIETILQKQGEVVFYINEAEKFISKFENENKGIKKIDSNKITSFMSEIFKNYSSDYFLPVDAESIMINLELSEIIDKIFNYETKFIKNLELKKKSVPLFLFSPFTGEANYIKELNLIIIPLYKSDISQIYYGFALFKWEMDTLHNVKTEYSTLKQNRGLALEILKKKFIEKYYLFLSDRDKFLKTEQSDTVKFFEEIIK